MTDLTSPPEDDDGGRAAAVATGAISQPELDRLTDEIITALKTVFDPEIPVDIYELGLIYKVDVSDTKDVAIDMTLTAPGCPVAGEMPGWVEDAVKQIPGIGQVKVDRYGEALLGVLRSSPGDSPE